MFQGFICTCKFLQSQPDSSVDYSGPKFCQRWKGCPLVWQVYFQSLCPSGLSGEKEPSRLYLAQRSIAASAVALGCVRKNSWANWHICDAWEQHMLPPRWQPSQGVPHYSCGTAKPRTEWPRIKTALEPHWPGCHPDLSSSHISIIDFCFKYCWKSVCSF